MARDVARLELAAEAALEAGLDVWLSPTVWDRDAAETVDRTVLAARAAERLPSAAPGRITFVVGGELTLFMRGTLPGRTLNGRLKRLMAGGTIRSGAHNGPLNAVLARLEPAVRPVFGGPLTYASLPWEQVDWSASTSSASTITARRASRTATSTCSPRSSRRASRSSTPSSGTRRVPAETR